MTAPTLKDTRYDRQLRLWGDSGQRALESAKICLINATATGIISLIYSRFSLFRMRNSQEHDSTGHWRVHNRRRDNRIRS